jgi:DinB family protein
VSTKQDEIGRPADSEFAPFFAGYVSLVPESDVLSVLEAQRDDVRTCALGVSAARETYSYGPGKWNLRELFSHVSDAERVFGYRAFCISRGEQAALPAFDEQQYTARSGASNHPLAELVDEFTALRDGNLAFLKRLDAAAWTQVGTANQNRVSVRALAFIMAGHVRHHLEIVRARYA